MMGKGKAAAVKEEMAKTMRGQKMGGLGAWWWGTREERHKTRRKQPTSNEVESQEFEAIFLLTISFVCLLRGLFLLLLSFHPTCQSPSIL
jgi:hypothetical protein